LIPQLVIAGGIMSVTIAKMASHGRYAYAKDAKLLLEAVEKRFGGNAATKKTQRNLLKQQYENFTAPSSEMLDQTFRQASKTCESVGALR
ncbi:hypothetical protein Tco_0406468, partial [Tanacetum coccineum]